jgi:hypothetical protein
VVWNPSRIGYELYIDGIFLSQAMLIRGLRDLENKIFLSMKKIFFDLPIQKYLSMAQDILNCGAERNQFLYDSLLDLPSVKKLTSIYIQQLSGSIQFQNDFMENGFLTHDSMKKFLARSTKLCQLLLCALHLSSGLPGRATEIQSLRIRKNGGLSNNVWIMNGNIVTITYYNKTISNSDESRPIVRVIPMNFSVYFLLYISCVRNIEM